MTDEELDAIEARVRDDAEDGFDNWAAERQANALLLISELRAVRERLKAVEGLIVEWRKEGARTGFCWDDASVAIDELEAALRGGK